VKINVAYFQEQGVNCLVFDADHQHHTQSGRAELLASLDLPGPASGLVGAKSVLAFVDHGRLTYFGTPDLTRFLSGRGLPRWTHTLDI